MEIQVGEIVLHLDEETLSYSIRTGGKFAISVTMVIGY